MNFTKKISFFISYLGRLSRKEKIKGIKIEGQIKCHLLMSVLLYDKVNINKLERGNPKIPMSISLLSTDKQKLYLLIQNPYSLDHVNISKTKVQGQILAYSKGFSLPELILICVWYTHTQCFKDLHFCHFTNPISFWGFIIYNKQEMI